MKHTEQELISLRNEVKEMWQLVLSQLTKAKQAFFTQDMELARKVISREKRVDAFELNIDSDSENYIALYNPVAIDLRLVLSLINISNTLERIADYAEAIARYVIESDTHGIEKIWEELRMEEMFDTVIAMLSDSFVALDSENAKLSSKILAKDKEVDEIYHNSMQVLAKFMQADADCNILPGLKTMLLIRKIERIGDHCSNLVEEIVFYIDAKVLKHSKNK